MNRRKFWMQTAEKPVVALEEFQPVAMVHTRVTRTPRARFPVIDFHTHITWGDDLGGSEKLEIRAKPEQVLPRLDECNVRMAVNLTGGFGRGLKQSVDLLSRARPDRFVVFTQPWWARLNEPSYSRFQAEQIRAAHAAGAKGLKILETLGLGLRENVTSGPLVKVDDARFDPMWEEAGSLKMPVAIHTSDMEAFFLPVDRFNERYEQLRKHPDWSFYGRDFPANMELQEARRRVMRRHPRTQFVCLHVADSENLEYVSQCMEEHRNMHVDIAARLSELGRQPRASRRFFERYQDRIVFGTDGNGLGGVDFYEPYFRFLETDDEYFAYAADVIPQDGRWRIYGIGLPDEILRKVYYRNAARLLGLES